MFKHFRTGFLGKASPVHFFWGGFDLAVTRFSGRRAPRHPSGIPHLPDAVVWEAYSHEVSSAGFWPGSGAIDYPAFYCYAYPEPAGFRAVKVRPDAAFFSEALGEFILPYDAVRLAARPEQALLEFLQRFAGMPAGPAALGAANLGRQAVWLTSSSPSDTPTADIARGLRAGLGLAPPLAKLSGREKLQPIGVLRRQL